MLIARSFTTYDLVVFRLFKDLSIDFFFMSFVYNVYSNLCVKQMWVQDNYSISIWIAEFYSLENLNIFHIHTNGSHLNVFMF